MCVWVCVKASAALKCMWTTPQIPLEKLDSSHVVEISPLVSYAGEGLEDAAKVGEAVLDARCKQE